MATVFCPKCKTMIFFGPSDPPGCPMCGYTPKSIKTTASNNSGEWESESVRLLRTNT